MQSVWWKVSRKGSDLHEKALAAISSAPVLDLLGDPLLLERVRFSKPNLLARFLASPLFNGGGASAITLGHTVFLLKDDLDLDSPEGKALLVHELKHVEQMERVGLLKFLLRYLWDYIRHGYGDGIAFEREAIQAEREAWATLVAIPRDGGVGGQEI